MDRYRQKQALNHQDIAADSGYCNFRQHPELSHLDRFVVGLFERELELDNCR